MERPTSVDRHQRVCARSAALGIAAASRSAGGGATYLVADYWPAGKTESTPLLAAPFEISCAKVTMQKGKPAILGQCQGALPAPQASSVQDKDPQSGKLELAFAALGIFVALVTAISLAVAKNATDEARQAEEKAKDLREELDYVAQARELADRLSFQRIEIQTTAQLVRAPILGVRMGVNPASLLEAKLRMVDEMLRWQAPDFDADALARQVDALVAVMDNSDYRPHLKAFFDQRDIEACDALIQSLNKPVYGAQRSDYLLGAKALVQLLRKLRTL